MAKYGSINGEKGPGRDTSATVKTLRQIHLTTRKSVRRALSDRDLRYLRIFSEYLAPLQDVRVTGSVALTMKFDRSNPKSKPRSTCSDDSFLLMSLKYWNIVCRTNRSPSDGDVRLKAIWNMLD